MRKFTYIIYSITLLYLIGCTPSRKTANITNTQMQEHADDTFAADIEIDLIDLDTVLISHPSDYIQDILDTLIITQHIFDLYNADRIYSELFTFYHLKDTQAVWVTVKKPTRDFDVLLNELLTAGRHGLNPADYNAYKLVNLKNQVYDSDVPDPLEMAILDVRTSISYVTYAYHLANGATPPKTKAGLEIAPPVSVASIIAENAVSKAVKLLLPTEEAYGDTMQALAKYKACIEEGGWEPLPMDLNIRVGDSSEYVLAMAERFKRMGDLPKKAEVTEYFDSAFVEGVINFQLRHGLETDGIVGKSTVHAYNVSLADKIHALEMNLERMRWLPQDLGDHYVFVNIPDFTLKIYEHKKEVLQMRTIVGREASQTPIFREDLEYIVFSPTWTVPRSIVLNEIIPHQRKDPNWLTQKGYKLYAGWDESESPLDPSAIDWVGLDPKTVNYRVVQNPGPTNALGLVKFIMPNSENIYLHDTPSDYLFERSKRAFSHGCIRLQYPDQLAIYLLKDNKDWDERRIRKAMNSDQPQTVLLDEKLPVYLTYRSAWGEKDGTVQFRSDIYGYDKLYDYGRFASVGR